MSYPCIQSGKYRPLKFNNAFKQAQSRLKMQRNISLLQFERTRKQINDCLILRASTNTILQLFESAAIVIRRGTYLNARALIIKVICIWKHHHFTSRHSGGSHSMLCKFFIYRGNLPKAANRTCIRNFHVKFTLFLCGLLRDETNRLR